MREGRIVALVGRARLKLVPFVPFDPHDDVVEKMINPLLNERGVFSSPSYRRHRAGNDPAHPSPMPRITVFFFGDGRQHGKASSATARERMERLGCFLGQIPLPYAWEVVREQTKP